MTEQEPCDRDQGRAVQKVTSTVSKHGTLKPSQSRNAKDACVAAGPAHSSCSEPVSYACCPHPPVKIPSARGSLQEMEQFAEKITNSVLAGRSLGRTLGIDAEKGAIELMCNDEKEMYHYWKDGKLLPDVDGLERLSDVEKKDDTTLWNRRGRDLNNIYEVTSFTSDSAKAWWKANKEWRPLLIAIGMVRQARFQIERRTLRETLRHFGAHRRWVSAYIARRDKNKNFVSRILRKRLDKLDKWLRDI